MGNYRTPLYYAIRAVLKLYRQPSYYSSMSGYYDDDDGWSQRYSWSYPEIPH